MYLAGPRVGPMDGGGPPNRPVPRIFRPQAHAAGGASGAQVPRRRRADDGGDRDRGEGPWPRSARRGGPRVSAVPLAQGGAGPREGRLLQDLGDPEGRGEVEGGPRGLTSPVLRDPYILDELLPDGHAVDGVDHGPTLPQSLLDPLEVDPGSFEGDPHALRFLVDLVKGAVHAVDPLDRRQLLRHLDNGGPVGLEDVENDALDVAHGHRAPGGGGCRTGGSLLKVPLGEMFPKPRI